MSDEARTEEETEVEAHGFTLDTSDAGAQGLAAAQEDDESDVEAHGFQMGSVSGTVSGTVADSEGQVS